MAANKRRVIRAFGPNLGMGLFRYWGRPYDAGKWQNVRYDLDV